MSNRWIFPVAVSLVLSACGFESETEADYTPAVGSDRLVASFSPSSAVIPFPSDLLFAGSTDGTLNAPVEDASDLADPAVALNGVDGFSTLSPWRTTLAGALDTSTLNGNAVRVYAISNTGLTRLAYGVQYVAQATVVEAADGSSTTTLYIVPLAPLAPKTQYLAVLTNDLASTGGAAAEVDTVYHYLKRPTPLVVGGINTVPLLEAQAAADPDVIAGTQTASEAALESAQTLDVLRAATNQLEALAVAESVGNGTDGDEIESDDIVLSWTVTTQSTMDVLQALYDGTAPAENIMLVPAGVTSPNGAANMYVGYIDVPYYGGTGASAMSTFWTSDGTTPVTYLAPTPQLNTTLRVPLLASVPGAGSGQAKPETGWPVVIFQHGITSSRSALFGAADTLALTGFMAVAIDLPLHGIVVDPDNPAATDALHASAINTALGLTGDAAITEQHFELDLVTQTVGADQRTVSVPGPDGKTDSSGNYFINLANLMASRDNARQAIANLFVLEASIGNLDLDGDAGTTDVEAGNYDFVGHSLGAMIGSVYGAFSTKIDNMVLGMPGSGIAKLLDGSSFFGAVIAAGLESAAGIERWSADYEAFLLVAQTVLDSIDPANFAAEVVDDKAVLLFEIVGDGTGVQLPDSVIPNYVATGMSTAWRYVDSNNEVQTETGTYGGSSSVFAGTDPMIALYGATQLTASIGGATPLVVASKITAGAHSSLLDPTPSAAAITEIQTQMASFLGSAGTAVVVTDTSVVKTD